jgi:hypothetical protein
MITPTVTIEQMKRGFFDRAGILERMATERGRAIRRVMLLTRTIAKRSLRVRPRRVVTIKRGGQDVRVDRTRYSRPGQPPTVRGSSSPLKRLLFAAYDTRTESGVAGNTPLNGSGGAQVVLEKGGNVTITSTRNVYRSGQRVRVKETKQARIAPRPFMAPAFRTGIERVPQEFRDILHRGGDL